MIEWKEVLDHKEYQVSNTGMVRNKKTGLVLRPVTHPRGYLIVFLGYGVKRKTKTIHRLVAEVFLKKSEGREEINHKNMVKSDNRAENLEWVSHQENISHAVKNGAFDCIRGVNNIRAVLNEDKVIEIRTKYNKEKLSKKENHVIVELAKEYGVSRGCVWNVVRGITWKSVIV